MTRYKASEVAQDLEVVTVLDMIRELRRMAAFIRTPGNITNDDAVDQCARVLENRAGMIEKGL